MLAPRPQICPPGTRTDGYVCLPCSESVPAAYEVAYLVFWVATVSVLHLTAWLATYRPFRHISYARPPLGK